MKVLIIIPYLALSYGGPAQVVRSLAQALSQLEITVDLVTTNAGIPNKLEVPLQTWVCEEGYRIQYFDCWYRENLILSPSLLYWVYRHTSEYHLVHTHNRFAPLILISEWICRWFKVPYMTTPHGMLEPWALSHKAWKKQLYFKLLEKPSLQQARLIQALNDPESKNLKSLGLSQLTILPNGVHRQDYELSVKLDAYYQEFPQLQNKSVILFLGRIDPMKGLDLLAQAFPRVHLRFPNTHLVIAGPDSTGYLSTIRECFHQAGCLEAVTFTGMLTGYLKQAALASAQIFVAPSYSEGFSVSVLEGMASGLPCVITRNCNFPEAEAAQAACVVEAEADAIASALIECLSRPQQAQTMGFCARQLVFKHYTWDKIANQLVRAYQAVVEDDRSLGSNSEVS